MMMLYEFFYIIESKIDLKFENDPTPMTFALLYDAVVDLFCDL